MKIQIASCDDWSRLWINGAIKYENHSIDGIDLLNLLGIEYEYKSCYEQAEKEDGIPTKWEDIIEDK